MADFLSEIFGSKPQIADFQPLDLTQEQKTALQGNIDNFPQIAQIGDLFQSYLLGAYDKAIPGFTDILKLGGTTTKDMLSTADEFLHGKIPQDVQDQIQRSDAYKTLMSGGGAAFGKSLTARDFGLTSLNLINQGANLAGQAGNAAQRWASLSGAQLPPGMLLTPEQQANFDLQQNLIKQATQQTKNNVAAAPNPGLQALNQWVEQVGGSIIGAYATGGMGGRGNYTTSYNPGTSYGDPNVGNYASFPVSLGGGTGDWTGGVAAPNDTMPLPTGGDVNVYNTSPYQSGIGTTNPFGDTGATGSNLWFNPYGG